MWSCSKFKALIVIYFAADFNMVDITIYAFKVEKNWYLGDMLNVNLFVDANSRNGPF